MASRPGGETSVSTTLRATRFVEGLPLGVGDEVGDRPIAVGEFSAKHGERVVRNRNLYRAIAPIDYLDAVARSIVARVGLIHIRRSSSKTINLRHQSKPSLASPASPQTHSTSLRNIIFQNKIV